MKFLADAHLPPGLARTLRESGSDAIAVRKVGLRDASDQEIWRYALQEGPVIITKDEDFADRCLYELHHPAMIT